MKDYLLTLVDFTEEEIESILSYGSLQKAEAGEVLFWGDQPFLKLWFLEEGLIRAYRLIDGKDYTFFFFTPDHFATDYQSYLTEQNSNLLFEALTDVTYTQFNKRAMLALYNRYPRFERLGRKLAEWAYLSATERLKQYQTEPLEVRYKKLIERNPALFQQVPQYHIASYLGVSAQSLSRVKAKIAGKIYGSDKAPGK